MNTQTLRTQTSFRLNKALVETLREEAQKHNRSLNNYVESILLAFVNHRPNPTTLAAMKEAERGENLDTLDLSNFRAFVNSL